ncbi:hypothetical protein SDC9_60130 [bioreactor metagenome]|uniref:RiboL-PSP-HEPN domain-containing protein n=1 Tax=bioreactor metagenome TaxID=1076179 RepID=A0A644XDF2_9ZZZZ
MKIVYVKGSIIIDTDKFVYADIMAYTSHDIEKVFEKEDLEIHEKDLIIDDNYQSSMFTYYFATKEVASYKIGVAKWPSLPYFLFKDLESDILKIRTIYNVKFDDSELYNTLYKQSFVSLITLLEVFLTELLFSFVFRNEDVFNQFNTKVDDFIKRQLMLGHKPKTNVHNRVDCENLLNFYIRNIRYQELEKIQKIYEEMFNISFPEVKKLSQHIKKRNDIVHRNGHDMDGIHFQINKEDLENVISDLKTFINEICSVLDLKKTLNFSGDRGCDYILEKTGSAQAIDKS